MRRARRLLDELRDILGPTPRSFGFFERWWLRQRPPSYIRRDDDLMEVYECQGMLLREGEIVWGALVQANSLLFSRGYFDHPAMVVYSPDPFFDDVPGELQDIAHRLFELKNTSPKNPTHRRHAEMITDERERGMGWRVPKSCTGGRDVWSTSVMVFRMHIPGLVLRSGWFPLLTHPETTAVMIVPKKFWQPELVTIWKEGAEID